MAALAPNSDLRFKLHVKQSLAFHSDATEILYGGSAGSAKSHLMRVAAIAWCGAIDGLQVYFFRRIREDLIKNHMEGPTGFRSLLAPLVQAGHVEIVEDEIRFANGSKIYMCHCKDEKDRFKYQGAEIHVLIIDELTHFTDVIYRYLRSRVRMPISVVLPPQYAKRFPRILCGTNPGGIGHQWVKATWIDAAPPYEIWKTPANEGGFVRQFIPARLTDNPSIDQEQYANNLAGLGNPELVKAMLEGDWNVVAGAALEVTEHHKLRAFTPPKHWTRFTSFDWGYVKPYCQGWYCVAEGNTLLKGNHLYPDRYIPDGAIIRYRELYGCTGKPDEGVREESELVVQKILKIEREAMERIDYRVADTGIWAKNDGPSTFERMFNASRDEKGVSLFCPQQSIKDRQASYNELCMRLRGEMDEDKQYVPMFYVTDNCRDWWRTVPSLILDEKQPEKGADEKQELHAYDETCYAIMSRPRIWTKDQRHLENFKKLRRQNNLDKTDPYRIKPKSMTGKK